MPGLASACPQCGAPLHFGGKDSLATVCAHCRVAVARRDALGRLETIGRVPDLVATDSRLALGMTGKLGVNTFVLVGHAQYDEGSGAWDEWWAQLDDGGAAWLVEMRGSLRWDVAVDAGRMELPRLAAVWAGMDLELAGEGTYTVDEVGSCTLVSAEGELPFEPALGARYLFVEASDGEGGRAALDYGEEGRPPMAVSVRLGERVGYAQLALGGQVAERPRAAAQALVCPSCGGTLSVKLATTRAVTCPSCHALVDVSGGGAALLARLAGRRQSEIPLGAKGRLGGEELEVIGWLRREVESAGEHVQWNEYLLYGEGGYRWLVEERGHFTVSRPIPSGKISNFVDSLGAECDGRRFRCWRALEAKNLEVQGEFYWPVQAEHSTLTQVLVAPPYVLTAGYEERELAWRRGEAIEADAVWRALSLPGSPPKALGVGAAAPNRFAAAAEAAWPTAGLALFALAAIGFGLALVLPARVVGNLEVPVDSGAAQLHLDVPARRALGFAATGGFREAGVGVDVAVVDERSGDLRAVGLNLVQHRVDVLATHAFDLNELEAHAVVPLVPPGRYLVRAQAGLVGPLATTASAPRSVSLQVAEHTFLLGPLFAALFLLLGYPLTLAYRANAFERRRWLGPADPDDAPEPPRPHQRLFALVCLLALAAFALAESRGATFAPEVERGVVPASAVARPNSYLAWPHIARR